MPPLLAISLGTVGVWLLTILGMAGIGVVVWRILQRQESADSSFLQKLEDDDARAERGNRAAPTGVPPAPSDKV